MGLGIEQGPSDHALGWGAALDTPLRDPLPLNWLLLKKKYVRSPGRGKRPAPNQISLLCPQAFFLTPSDPTHLL